MSENVATFTGFNQSELNGENIYNIIHSQDHARFSSSLLPAAAATSVSSPWSSPASQNDNQTTPTLSPLPSSTPATGAPSSFSSTSSTAQPPSQQQQQVPSASQSNNSLSTPSTPTAPPPAQQKAPQQRSFNIRLLTKNQAYENIQISSILTPHPGLEENCLVCIARRLPPNERAPGQAPVQQFTTKLLTDGRLIGVDTSGLSGLFRGYIGKVRRHNFEVSGNKLITLY